MTEPATYRCLVPDCEAPPACDDCRRHNHLDPPYVEPQLPIGEEGGNEDTQHPARVLDV